MIKRILGELSTTSRSGNWAIKFLLAWQGGKEGKTWGSEGEKKGGAGRIFVVASRKLSGDREEAGPSMSLHFMYFLFYFESCL